MSLASYILGVLAALFTLGVVVEGLRRRRLRERHAVWWLIAGLLALIIGLFPSVLIWAAGVVGVEVPTNLVFFVSIAILFLVSIQHSAELTALESKTRVLAEEIALQNMRLEELTQRFSQAKATDVELLDPKA
ncbi:MAG TPA: DUF2304 domain-containing protein [Glaciibacter sp.]|nr:DUF2304 domain-containing protein [Glaciibacter sp.]